MPTDLVLLDELRTRLSSYGDVVEKRITGGVGFMWRGNLLCGVLGTELLVRVDKTVSSAYVGEDAARMMVMGGREARGWIMVQVPVHQRDVLLTKWIERAAKHCRTLPAK